MDDWTHETQVLGGPERPDRDPGRRRRWLPWGAAAAAAALLLGGGVLLGTNLASGPSAELRGDTAADGAAAAVLDEQAAMDLVAGAAEEAESGPPGHRAGGPADRDDRIRRRLALRLRMHRAVHGEVTVRRGEEFLDFAFQRGSVTTNGSGQLTVTSEDGVRWTWKVTGDTRVRRDGERTTAGELAVGDRVYVGGPVDGQTRTAAIVVVPRPRPAPSPSSS